MKNVIMALLVLMPAVVPAMLPAHAQAAPKVVRFVDNPPPSKLPVYVPQEKPKEEKLPVPNEVAPRVIEHVMTAQDFGVNEIYYGMEDVGDIVDVGLTFNALETKLGRKIEMRDILYITIWSEYWLAVKGKTHALLGQEALARSYYHFCGEDGECTHAELMKFLSGYQPWFGNLAKVDMKHDARADKLIEWLTNEYNYAVNGEEVYGYVDEILDVEFAEEQGWTTGKEWNRPSQWYGPSGPPPCSSCVGSYTASYAIASVRYGGGYFYFVTYGQELSFTPTALP